MLSHKPTSGSAWDSWAEAAGGLRAEKILVARRAPVGRNANGYSSGSALCPSGDEDCFCKCLKLDWFQHPSTARTAYRLEDGWAQVWKTLPERARAAGVSLKLDLQPAERAVWVRMEGALAARQAQEMWDRMKEGLANRKERLVLDLATLSGL